MIYLIICILFYIIVFIFDIVPLIKARRKKTLLVYLPVFLLTLVINILFGLGVKIPSPMLPIKNAVSLIFGVK
jgi:hypothetical protein